MSLRKQYRPSARRDAGYAMAGLLVAIAVMGIAMSMLMPTWRTWAKREREAELIFRGEQYTRAIELYQRQFAGAYPTDMKMLVDQRFLRKLYTDPVTNDGTFEVLTQASVRAAPGQTTPVAGLPALGQQQFTGVTRVDQDTSSPTPFSRAARESNEGAGGIIGVVSSSTDSSMALYGGRDRYDEWLFVYLPQAAQPGLGTGVPGQGGGVESTLQDRIFFGDRPGGGARGRGGRGGQEPGQGGQRPGAGADRAGPSGQGLGALPRR